MKKLAVLADRRLIQLEGPDWRGFLQGLISQNVESLEVGALAYGALLTPQGRLLFDMFILAREDGATLDVAAEGRDALIARLSMYRLRSKVVISAQAGDVFALFPGDPPSPLAAGHDGPSTGIWRADPRLERLGWRAMGEAPPPSGPSEAVDLDAYHAHRIALGVPDLTRDGLAEKAYAVEADLDLLNGVDFAKGCFVGQETTSRMKRRGQVKTRICSLTFDGGAPPPGAEVLASGSGEGSPDLRAGEVLSGCDGHALGMMRLDRAFGRDLSVDGRPVRCEPADWLRPALNPARPEAI